MLMVLEKREPTVELFVCVQTKEVVQSLKINGSVSGVAFSPDGSNVFAQSGRFPFPPSVA